jgi:hypothetical protein
MPSLNANTIFLTSIFLIFSACSKGYEVRFTNYYIEPMDSVIVGNNLVVFKNINLESASDYQKIQNGKHSVTCITNKKKKFYGSINIPKNGSGKRTIQLDAINNFSILED